MKRTTNAFFSISRSKLPGYILPSIPALLILGSVAVHRREMRREHPYWPAIAAHAVLLAALMGMRSLRQEQAALPPQQPVGIRNNPEEKDPAARAKNNEALRRTAADPVAHRPANGLWPGRCLWST